MPRECLLTPIPTACDATDNTYPTVCNAEEVFDYAVYGSIV